MTSKPMLLAGLAVLARVEKRSHHHGDVADGRFNLLDNESLGLWKFFIDFFGEFASPHLHLLEGENTDANGGVGQVFGFHF